MDGDAIVVVGCCGSCGSDGGCDGLAGWVGDSDIDAVCLDCLLDLVA